MKLRQTVFPSRNRSAGLRSLSLTLVTLLLLPPVGFATPPGAGSPPESGARAAAAPLAAATFVVDTTEDPGSLINCADKAKRCSLRDAIQKANAAAGDDVIEFSIPATDPGCDATTGHCTIALSSALPILNTNVDIRGPGADKLTVRRSTGGNYRLFISAATGPVSISGLRLLNGHAGTGTGGAVANGHTGTVNVASCIVADSSAGTGGGIANALTGTVNVTNSVIAFNHATGTTSNHGGGISNDDAGTVNVTNSVVFSNSAFFNSSTGSTGRGGGIFNATGTLNISNSTVTLNQAATDGAGVVGPATVKSTVIAENHGDEDVRGSFTSRGFNLIGIATGSVGFTQPMDQTGSTDTPLAPEFDTNGALVFGASVPGTPLCGSPLLDRGTGAAITGPLTTDVRGPGFPRTVDDPDTTNAAEGTDVGALERQTICPIFTFTVNTTGDADDVNPGDAVCDSSSAEAGEQCTLRAAITETNLLNGLTVNFAIPATDAGFNPLTGGHTINLPRALPEIISDVTISGPGAGALTVRRNSGGSYGVFSAAGNADAVNISGLTVSGGRAPRGGGINFSGDGVLTVTASVFENNYAEIGGGGIALNVARGTLNVNDCTFTGNFTSSSAAEGGGGIRGGKLNVANSTFSNNSGPSGGAISVFNNDASITGSTFTNNFATNGGGVFYSSPTNTLTVTNSTFDGNSANSGGGIYHKNGSTKVTNSTISENTAVQSNNGGGGLRVEAGAVRVKSSIIAGNTISGGDQNTPDVSGAVTSDGFNLIGRTDGSTGFTHPTDQTGTGLNPLDTKLDPNGLQNNGGPTQTIALQANSPAVDKGTAGGLTGTLTTDQRSAGFTRTFDDPATAPATGGDNTDIGAFERNPAAPTPTPTPTPTATPTPTPTPIPTPSPTPTSTPTTTPEPTPAPTVPTFQFDAASYAVVEGVTSVAVRVLRTGPSTTPVTVDLTSEDGTAKQKGDYTFVVGRLVFAAGETEKSFEVLVNDDAYAEGDEFATLLLQHPSGGAALGNPNTTTLTIMDNVPEASANPVDDSRAFVGTHYHDLLYRQGDTAGIEFWTQQIESCGADAGCRVTKRADVSAAFFLSLEFQQTGYLVIRTHKAAFGNLKSNPRYAVFLRDQRQVGNGLVVGQAGWEQQLASNQRKYLEDFVSRPEFVAQFPQGQFAGDFADGLFLNVDTTPTQAERDAAVASYGAGDTAGRAAALRGVVESGSVFNALYNPTFVLMQYYGYLRRNPDDLPDGNFAGYDFWLQKLDQFTLPDEDARDEQLALARVRRAEMVRAFVESAEYRKRFGGAAEGNQQGLVEGASAARWKRRDELARGSPPFLNPLLTQLNVLRRTTQPNQ